MSDTVELTLKWDLLTDVDSDKTERIAFETKPGKRVEFAKVIRCKDCKYFFHWAELNIIGCKAFDWRSKPDDFCSFAERKEE